MKRGKVFGGRRRKAVTAGAVGLVALVATVAGFAYFSGNSQASKPVTTGSAPALALTIDSIAGQPLYPGDTSAVTYHVQNLSGHNSGIGKVVLDTTFPGSSNGFDGLPAGCLASWFSFPDVVVGTAIANGATKSSPADIPNGSLSFTDTGSPQDECQNANLTIHLKVIP